MTLLGKVASMATVTRCLWISQIALASLLVLCSVIAPSVVSSDGGVSNFGNRLTTVVPYTLSFRSAPLFVARSGCAREGTPDRKWYGLTLVGLRSWIFWYW